MKKILLITALVISSFTGIFAQGIMRFKTEMHDFGKITEGTQATHTFEFTNAGTAPIVISNVMPSCGCTTPEWTKEPVMPGKTGKITVTFNSQGRPGVFNKTTTVHSNSEVSSIVLSFKGEVLKVSGEAHIAPVKAVPARKVNKK